jgi:hypothetical protein
MKHLRKYLEPRQGAQMVVAGTAYSDTLFRGLWRGGVNEERDYGKFPVCPVRNLSLMNGVMR